MHFVKNILNDPELLFLHILRWFQVFHPNSGISEHWKTEFQEYFRHSFTIEVL